MASRHEPNRADRTLGAPTASLAYLGGLAILGGSMVGALISTRKGRPSVGGAVLRRLDETFRIAFPIVGLIHVGFGSFLSMQAYYGATFKEANGAVVGLGLIRNVAPMVTAYVLAAIGAVRITAELRRGLDPELDRDPREVPDREVARGQALDERTPTTPARLTLVRVLAASIAGPILALWGAAVGTVVGALISQRLLGLSIGIYFSFIRELIRVPDAVGLLFNASTYCGASALIACNEGLRSSRAGDAPRARDEDPTASAARAMLLSILAILTINMAWFSLVYLSGSPTGPEIAG